MKPEDKAKIIENTKPKAPDPEVMKHEKEKVEKEREEKARTEDQPKQGTRGPKSNLVKRAEEEAASSKFREKCRKAGRAACDSLVIGGYTFFGPEFAYIPPFKINPDDPNSPVVDEKARMQLAYEDMFEAYGWDIIPPWIPVLTVTGAYVASRVNMPSVRERMKGGFFSGLKERLKSIGKKKEVKPDATHADLGGDGKRKDNPSN